MDGWRVLTREDHSLRSCRRSRSRRRGIRKTAECGVCQSIELVTDARRDSSSVADQSQPRGCEFSACSAAIEPLGSMNDRESRRRRDGYSIV